MPTNGTTNRHRATTLTAFTTVLLLAGALAAPAASATGWLINYEGPVLGSFKFGSNLFGGQGDTLDVGWGNRQCSDEDDVVDIGIQNREGDEACMWEDPTGEQGGCKADEGEGIAVLSLIGATDTHPHEPHCTDDGDTVDIGIMNREGGFHDEQCRTWWDPETEPHPQEQQWFSGDRDDAVDVGVLNHECNDDEDAVDVGVLNCELSDRNDGVDVGVLNREDVVDRGDTFDLSVANAETFDGPDQNGLNLLTGLLGIEACHLGVDTRLPIIG